MALPLVKWDDTARQFRAYEDNDSGLTAFQVKWDDTYNRFRILGNFVPIHAAILGDNRKMAAGWRAYAGAFYINNMPFYKFDTSLNNIWGSISGGGNREHSSYDSNVYRAGSVGGGFFDYGSFEKYDLLGRIIWRVSEVGGHGIDVDSSGNVFCAGARWGSASVWKLNDDGMEQWDYDTNGRANAIAVDGSGQAHIASTRTTNGDGGDFTVWKLDSSGNFSWGFDTGDEAYDIKVDGSGNVYVVSDGGATHQIYKLNSAGVEQWNFDHGADIKGVAVDGSGNVYLGCSEAGNKSVIKLNSAGVEQWSYDINDTAWDIDLDSSGNVYVVSGRGTNGDGTHTLWKLNNAGAYQTGFDAGSKMESLHIDANDNIFAGILG